MGPRHRARQSWQVRCTPRSVERDQTIRHVVAKFARRSQTLSRNAIVAPARESNQLSPFACGRDWGISFVPCSACSARGVRLSRTWNEPSVSRQATRCARRWRQPRGSKPRRPCRHRTRPRPGRSSTIRISRRCSCTDAKQSSPAAAKFGDSALNSPLSPSSRTRAQASAPGPSFAALTSRAGMTGKTCRTDPATICSLFVFGAFGDIRRCQSIASESAHGRGPCGFS